MVPLHVLDLFSGIGGFSLGLEVLGGFRTVAFCETDRYCRRVIARHWPGVKIYGDIRTLTAAGLAADGIKCDVLTGGFPCQDISIAGKGVGLAGARSGLWREYHRLICELRPRYAIVENVTALLGRGMGEILGDMAEIGYDCEWHCIPAAYVGAPHERDRVWIVAYTNVAGLERRDGGLMSQRPSEWTAGQGGAFRNTGEWFWRTEPAVGRVVDGLPRRVDRLRALGNAIVPQVAELIGAAILTHAEKSPGG